MVKRQHQNTTLPPLLASTLSMSGAVGTTPTVIISVKNTGPAPLFYTPTITGPDSAKFSGPVGTPFGRMAGDPPLDHTYSCIGSSAGTFTAVLNMTHNDSTITRPATYTLSCTITSAAGVTLTGISDVKATAAVVTGTASGAGIGERGFFWWNDEQYWGPNASGLIPAGYGAGDFSLNLTNLPILTQLYVRAYVKVNGQLVTSDNRISITTTGPVPPTVITKPDFTVSGNSVLAKGEITDVGSSPVMIYGFVYAEHSSPTVWDEPALPFTWDLTLPISEGKPFDGTIRNLAAGTYYVRSYAHNAQGTSYGEEFSFTIGGTVSDVPGDLNGDGHVDLTDVIIALKILDGIPVSNLNLKADVNGDVKIGHEEAIFVLQKVSLLR